jgi:putative transposase
MTRTVNGEDLFDDTAREVLRKQLWQVVEFCGLQIITYSILSDHFHVLVRVPKRTIIPDVELLRRYRVLHPHPTRYQANRIDVIEKELASNSPDGEAWRKKQLALMGDLSPFMKLLKQRFSIWFNRSHDRFGTLWAERFKSVLVEGATRLLQIMAVYIDLNSVRKFLVPDPKDYRFCGYAEAVSGNEEARRGLSLVCVEPDWDGTQAAYRQLLFGAGTSPRKRRGSISREDFKRVMAEGGKLPLAEVLRCRVRYFTDGSVLGSKAFVATQLAACRSRIGRRKQDGPHPLPAITDWGDLATLHGLRGPALG